MSDKSVGRPVYWTPERIQETAGYILETIATTELGVDHVINFHRQAGKTMPDPATFYSWLENDAELDKRYARAREQQQHLCIDNGVVLATNLVAKAPEYSIDPAAFRAYFDAVKFRAAKLAPKVYGDKQDITSNGKELKGGVIIVASQADKELLEKI